MVGLIARMHIADGILPLEFCAAGYAGALTGAYWFGGKPNPEQISRMGLFAAAAFVASLVHFPLAGVSVHLGLWGLLGVVLGRRAFPVVFAALLFQALFLGHGGIVSLGVNVVNMGAGALAGWGLWSISVGPAAVRAFAAGFAGAIVPAVIMALQFEAAGYGRGFFAVAAVYALVALVEGAATASIVGFLLRSKPEILQRVTA